MDKKEFLEKDTALRHAIQTGIKVEQEFGDHAEFYRNNPELSRIIKHIRTGLNCAMVEHGTMIKILIDKGLITEEEYFEASLFMLRKEVDHAERRISDLLGRDIKLGVI